MHSNSSLPSKPRSFIFRAAESENYRPSQETINSPLMDGSESLELTHSGAHTNGTSRSRQRAAIADAKQVGSELFGPAANGTQADTADTEAEAASAGAGESASAKASGGGEMMTFLRLVCMPWILVLAVSTAIAMASFAVLDPTLEPRLREVHLTPLGSLTNVHKVCSQAHRNSSRSMFMNTGWVDETIILESWTSGLNVSVLICSMNTSTTSPSRSSSSFKLPLMPCSPSLLAFSQLNL